MEAIISSTEKMKNYDYFDIKSRLKNYRELYESAEIQIERINMIKQSMLPGSPSLDVMPSGGTPVEWVDKLARIEEISKLIGNAQEKLEKERADLENILVNSVKSNWQCFVIRARYFDHMTWGTIASIIYSKEVDYPERREDYLECTYKLHQRALTNMTNYVAKKYQNL